LRNGEVVMNRVAGVAMGLIGDPERIAGEAEEEM